MEVRMLEPMSRILHIATTNSISLRTTIPSHIVAKLDLKKGYDFRWHLDGGELHIQVIKILILFINIM